LIQILDLTERARLSTSGSDDGVVGVRERVLEALRGCGAVRDAACGPRADGERHRVRAYGSLSFWPLYRGQIASAWKRKGNAPWIEIARRMREVRVPAVTLGTSAVPNRTLSADELAKANALLDLVRAQLATLAGDDKDLLFAHRRKVAKELTYDEPSKPLTRRKLKTQKLKEQGGVCTVCSQPLHEKYAVLDRFTEAAGYTAENTRLIHAECDQRIQTERGYA